MKATFGMGCFWKGELIFSKIPGVLKTEVGYMGGNDSENKVTYKQVCSGKTENAEVIQITFNKDKITYKALLDLFWIKHNPTTSNRQGFDIGKQYRSVIFYHNEEQKKVAKKSLSEEQKRLKRKIVTKIMKAKKFHKAEEYHQKYLEKKGTKTCKI